MPARLNHTIVWCRDKKKSARFLTEVLGLPPPRRFMQFLVVDLANDVSVDYYEEKDEPIALQHLAFLVGEDEFDAALARVRERRVAVWRAWRLLRRPRRPSVRDHHEAVRRSRRPLAPVRPNRRGSEMTRRQIVDSAVRPGRFQLAEQDDSVTAGRCAPNRHAIERVVRAPRDSTKRRRLHADHAAAWVLREPAFVIGVVHMRRFVHDVLAEHARSSSPSSLLTETRGPRAQALVGSGHRQQAGRTPPAAVNHGLKKANRSRGRDVKLPVLATRQRGYQSR
jgi:catechol 2,3-dioxygenase-like lactoylglutathione lyase family enzyme